jgi:C4-dicarboxylate-specific signal transduction histidine kinase
MSRSAERVAGLPYAELIAGGLAARTDPVFLEARRRFFLAIVANGRATFEYRMNHGDGTQHWMRTVGVCLERKGSGDSDIIGFVTDITEEHKMREQLRTSEKFAMLGEVAGRISHELRQPLATIAMAAENGTMSLQRDPPDAVGAQSKFQRIERQIERISAIMEEITGLSRQDGLTEATSLDLETVIRAALVVTEAKTQAQAIVVDLTMEPGLPPIHGVAVLLEQTLVNLISNACDAYADRPIDGERIVWVAARRQNASIIIRVSDQAGGIPEHLLGQIFEPFVTTKRTSHSSGLGLSISQASISRMGGLLTAFNQNGGACFEITLPLRTDA